MTKQPLTSFVEYQQSLLKRGMAISADCNGDFYGGIIFHQITNFPTTDLFTSVHDKAREALAGRFQKRHREMKSYGVTDDDYTQRLLEGFASEQETRQQLKMPDLEWIDDENPRSGIMAKAASGVESYFDLRADPRKFKQILNEDFDIEIDPRIRDEIFDRFDDALEELESDPDEGIDSSQCDWHELERFGLFLRTLSSRKSEKKYEKVVQSFVAKMLSPILINYTNHLLYIASEDDAYFVIGRPYFYPILAGERSDGSHEITIFEALNEF